MSITNPNGVDYRDPSVPLSERIAAADAAGDINWQLALKAEKLRSIAASNDRVVTAGGSEVTTLDERIAAAEAAGDTVLSISLKAQKLRGAGQTPEQVDAVARLAENQQRMEEAREARAAEDAARLEESNAARRQQYEAIQRLPGSARDLAMHRTFGGPNPAT